MFAFVMTTTVGEWPTWLQVVLSGLCFVIVMASMRSGKPQGTKR